MAFQLKLHKQEISLTSSYLKRYMAVDLESSHYNSAITILSSKMAVGINNIHCNFNIVLKFHLDKFMAR